MKDSFYGNAYTEVKDNTEIKRNTREWWKLMNWWGNWDEKRKDKEEDDQ